MPVTMPGMISGSTTLKKARTGGQPRSCAASKRFGFICRSFGRTDRITYGRQNVMCAMISDAMPRLRPPNRLTAATNSSIIETPVTISGFTIGKFVMFIMILRGSRFMRLMPTAAIVPSTVAQTAETTAMISVFKSASRI